MLLLLHCSVYNDAAKRAKNAMIRLTKCWSTWCLIDWWLKSLTFRGKPRTQHWISAPVVLDNLIQPCLWTKTTVPPNNPSLISHTSAQHMPTAEIKYLSLYILMWACQTAVTLSSETSTLTSFTSLHPATFVHRDCSSWWGGNSPQYVVRLQSHPSFSQVK